MTYHLISTSIAEGYAEDSTWSTDEDEDYDTMTRDQAYADEGCQVEFDYHEFSEEETSYCYQVFMETQDFTENAVAVEDNWNLVKSATVEDLEETCEI